jgi:hypothetical protein
LTEVALVTNNNYRKAWILTGDGMAHFAYPSGFLISPGQALQVYNGPGGGCSVGAEFHGYLTAN